MNIEIINEKTDRGSSEDSSQSDHHTTNDGYVLIPNGQFLPDVRKEAPVGEPCTRHVNSVKLWTEFNKKLPYFRDFYDGKSESFLLQSIFLQINHIAKHIGVDHDDVPVGVFCSSREDLVKLDEFLARIDHKLQTRGRRRTIMPNWDVCTLL